jgi:VCBS repeat-containing protein
MATKTGPIKHGTDRNDVLTTEREDEHFGVGRNNQFLGGAGNDRLKGDAANDTLDGGGGSDRVDGGSGNDLLIYTAAENRNARDAYDGGSGVDTLRLVLTRDEWIGAALQTDIARYLQFVSSHTNPSGQATGQTFGFTAFGLEATKFERLEVKVGGVFLDPRDEAVDARDDAARVGEDAARVAGNVLTGTLAGTDLVPDLVRSIQLVSGPTGGTIASSAGQYTYSGAGHGTLSLDAAGNFSYAPGAAFNRLGVGQTATETFTYRVTDADGDSDTAKLIVTIVGANDAPVAGTAIPTQTAAAGAAFSLTLPANTFTDPDGDALAYTAKLASGSALPAWLTFDASSRTFSGTPDSGDGGQTFPIRVAVSDGHGGTAFQTFTLDVRGNGIVGTEHDDTLYGTAGSDSMRGLGGNDELHGGASADRLDGGSGNDHLYGEDGDDVLDGGDGNDYVDGGAGNDVLKGGAGDDYLVDSSGNSQFFGGAGNDTIVQQSDGSANVVVDAGEGRNTITLTDINDAVVKAGSGDDTISISGFVGQYTIDAGDGRNTIDMPNAFGGMDVKSGSGNDSLWLAGSGTVHTNAGDDDITLAGFHTLDAGAGADRITIFSSAQNRITTGTGGDTIVPDALGTHIGIISDFSLADDDKLDLIRLLGSSGVNAGNLGEYVRLTPDGSGGTVVSVDFDGSGGAAPFFDVLVLEHTSGLNALDMFNSGNLLV